MDLCLFHPVLRVAVDAAIGFFAAVYQAEDVDDLLLHGGDAARVLALDHVPQRLRQLEVQLLFQSAVFDQIDRDIAVDVTEHIEVDIDAVVDLDNVFLAVLFAHRVLNDRHAAVNLVEPQKLIYHHTLARLDVVEHDPVFYTIYIHHLPPF